MNRSRVGDHPAASMFSAQRRPSRKPLRCECARQLLGSSSSVPEEASGERGVEICAVAEEKRSAAAEGLFVALTFGDVVWTGSHAGGATF